MDIYQRIIDLYKQYGTIRDVEREIGSEASKIRIQRVLITEGLWSSGTSRAVGKLHAEGKTSQQIADELFMSVKNVQSYLPYTRGLYGEKNTAYSKASRNYRRRNQNAAERMNRKIQEKNHDRGTEES